MMYRSVQFSSVTQSCPTLCDPMDCSMPGFPVHHDLQHLLKLVSIELVTPCNHLILCRPLLLQPSIFPSIRVISNESVFHIRWPEYWSFSFSISPSSEYSGLISFRTDWIERQLNNGNIYFTIQVIRDQEFVLKLFLRITQEVKADFIGRLEIIKMD